MRPLPRLLHPKELARLLAASVRQWTLHRAASKGAALSLYMVFSLAPVLILVIAVAGAVFGENAVRSELSGQVRDFMGERSAEVIQIVLASAHESGSGWLAALLSIAVLLFSATTAFAELKASLDELWETPAHKTAGIKGALKSRALSFGLVLVLALFLLLSLAINAGLGIARGYYGDLWTGSLGAQISEWASMLFSFSVVTALFAVVFKLLPSASMPWRHIVPGAIVTAALFLAGKWGIGLYLGQGGVPSAFGAAGSVIALLLWIYYSAQIFFLGAVLTRQYGLRARDIEAGGAAAEPAAAAAPEPVPEPVPEPAPGQAGNRAGA
jgi:membrane protein